MFLFSFRSQFAQQKWEKALIMLFSIILGSGALLQVKLLNWIGNFVALCNTICCLYPSFTKILVPQCHMEQFASYEYISGFIPVICLIYLNTRIYLAMKQIKNNLNKNKNKNHVEVRGNISVFLVSVSKIKLYCRL